jgi:hypothetical protein
MVTVVILRFLIRSLAKKLLYQVLLYCILRNKARVSI